MNDNNPLKVYYAHSIALYNTQQEKRDLAILYGMGFDVENPNTEVHMKMYEAQQLDYFKIVVQNCSILAFRANADGSINCGVAQEIEWATDIYMDIIELPVGITSRKLTYMETFEFLAEQGYR